MQRTGLSTAIMPEVRLWAADAANAAISLGIIKQLRLNSSTVESYEVLGGVAGAVSKNGYQVKIIFKDGKKSLLEVDEKLYKAIVQACF